jgi:hypothetical protein
MHIPTVYLRLYFPGSTITVFRFPTIKEYVLNREMKKQTSSSNDILFVWIRRSPAGVTLLFARGQSARRYATAVPSLVLLRMLVRASIRLSSKSSCPPTIAFPRAVRLMRS